MKTQQTMLRSAVVAGALAGLVMAMLMMAYMGLIGQSIWTNPNLIAVMWLGEGVATGAFGVPTLVGFATHMAASMLMGIIAIPFVAELPGRRTMLAAVSYALASYPVAIASVMSWANPLFVARSDVVAMTIAHAVFGVVFGAAFLAWPEPEAKL
jgi:hypothetical protein